MSTLTTIAIKLPRNNTYTPETAKTFLSTLTNLNKYSFWDFIKGSSFKPISLEIAVVKQQILFSITTDISLIPYIKTQLQSSYPLALIEETDNPTLLNQNLDMIRLELKNGNYYPLQTYDKFIDIDPLSNILSILSKCEADDLVIFQINLKTISSKWRYNALSYADHGTKNEDGSYSARVDKNIIVEKTSEPGFFANLKLFSNNKSKLQELVSAFGVFARSDGNQLILGKKRLTQNGNFNTVLNISELATLWHLPGEKTKVTNIVWGNSVLSESPENLPVASSTDEDKKSKVNFFARTTHKNKDVVFGIQDEDRRKHVWVIGKTGTGKSTLLENMAIDDMKKNRGIAYIDPHGDACETLLNYIPKQRINNVIYFNPIDSEYPITINPLEVKNKEEAELVVSGLMAIFTKVWANVWSARMEYILRNAFLTLAEIPGSTLVNVLSLISDKKYRDNILNKLDNIALVNFWKNEFDQMPQNLQKEAIAPIQNKVGQFVTSPLIKRVIGNSKSTISLETIMNEGKILLVNLSQGRLGEDNSALLGAMLITKLQLVAMRRVDMQEQDRRDFYLYVDEFQNFATTSFIKILSEARKYKLSITLANQYMDQIPDDVQKAILGNAGTIVCFTLGAKDAEVLKQEFTDVFDTSNLVNLSKYEIALKMTIDGETSRPFLAKTLPLPKSINQNKIKVITSSRQRYARKE